MTVKSHDPLCPLKHLSMLKSGCPQCELIALGRNAAQEQLTAKYADVPAIWQDGYIAALDEVEQKILAKVYRDPITAVQVGENSGLGMAWSITNELRGNNGQR